MTISKRTAVGVSGLVFAGAAVLGVGAASPASASGCCGGGHHKNYSSAKVYNKNFNFSRSDSQEAQRNHQRQFEHENEHDFDFPQQQVVQPTTTTKK